MAGVADAAGDEYDDHSIPVSDNTEVPVQPPEDQLHDPDHDPGPPGIPETNGPLPGTGILIDEDEADSRPPPDTYDFVVIISPPDDPSTNPNPPNLAQVDAIQVTEVPLPPTPYYSKRDWSSRSLFISFRQTANSADLSRLN